MALAFPPAPNVAPSLRDLVAGGHLLQRELVARDGFARLGHERGLRTGSLDEAAWEAWDRTGVLSPLAFHIGMRQTQHQVGRYPMDDPRRDPVTDEWCEGGYVFRDEVGYCAWDRYRFELHGFPYVTPLYSEWQLLALPLVRQFETLGAPVTTLAEDDETILRWASPSLRTLAEMHRDGRQQMHASWLPLVKVLIRLQSRYWPWVNGSTRVLHGPDPQEGDRPSVDALELELAAASAMDVRDQLGLEDQDILGFMNWLGWRLRGGLDDQLHLRDLTHLLPRRQQLRARKTALQALDVYDAYTMLRRFYWDLTGVLLLDADQGEPSDSSIEPRPMRRDTTAVQAAFQAHGLVVHKMHIVVEGETEVRLVSLLFEALTGRSLERSGIAITNLEGDKLEESRRFLVGFGLYARRLVLLLDDENEAERVARKLADDGVLSWDDVHLAKPSLEQANFTSDELIAMVNDLDASRSDKLGFTGTDLESRLAKYNKNAKLPLGIASMLQRMAKNPTLGPVIPFNKPDLAAPMVDLILSEVRAADGDWPEVLTRRPILDWVRRFPMAAVRAG